MNKTYSHLTFYDLFIHILKYKYLFIFIFLFANSSLILTAQQFVQEKAIHKVNLYSDLITFDNFTILIGEDNETLKQIENIELGHQEFVKNIYLNMHRRTELAKVCKEFKINIAILISSIECIGSNINQDYFKSLLYENYYLVIDKQLNSLDSLNDVHKEFIRENGTNNANSGIIFLSKYSSSYIYFLLLLNNLFLILLIFVHFFFKNFRD